MAEPKLQAKSRQSQWPAVPQSPHWETKLGATRGAPLSRTRPALDWTGTGTGDWNWNWNWIGKDRKKRLERVQKPSGPARQEMYTGPAPVNSFVSWNY